jgi:hypothetical protein
MTQKFMSQPIDSSSISNERGDHDDHNAVRIKSNRFPDREIWPLKVDDF